VHHVNTEEGHPSAIGLLENGAGKLLARSTTVMLSSPRKPPSKRYCPGYPLSFTHQVEVNEKLVEVFFQKLAVGVGAVALDFVTSP
jgi:hypothetical protein